MGPGLNAERNIYAFSNYIVEIVTMFVIGIWKERKFHKVAVGIGPYLNWSNWVRLKWEFAVDNHYRWEGWWDIEREWELTFALQPKLYARDVGKDKVVKTKCFLHPTSLIQANKDF